MSENRNRGTHDFEKYDSMSTEELEQILRLDAEAPEGQDSDTELLLYVMEVLANRRNNANITGKTALEAWESFQKNYLPEEDEYPEHTVELSSKRTAAPWLRRVVAAAAVIVLVICVPLTASAFGWDDLWNVIAHWAKETFSFVSGEDKEVSEPSPEDVENYMSLQEVLHENNRDPNLIPTWIPDGYALDFLNMDVTPAQEVYIAFYRNGEKELTIRVLSYLQEDPEKLEINEELLEIYEVSGVQYYIFSNMNQTRAVWIKGSYQCNISGDLSIDEVKEMIDSIGKG